MTCQHISNIRSFITLSKKWINSLVTTTVAFFCTKVKEFQTCCSRCDILSLQEDFTSVSCCRDSANFCSSVLLCKWFITYSTYTSTTAFLHTYPINRRSIVCLHLNLIRTKLKISWANLLSVCERTVNISLLNYLLLISIPLFLVPSRDHLRINQHHLISFLM